MKLLRLTARIAVLLFASFLALQAWPAVFPDSMFPWRDSAVLLPALSPFSGACAFLASRSASWIILLAVPVTVLALARGCWFCRWMCPTGFLAELASGVGRGKVRLPRLAEGGRLIVLAGLSAAALGGGLAIWLDPLAMFNGFVASFWPPFFKPALWLAIGFAAVLAASAVAPRIWCYGLCPLGAMQDMLGRAGKHIADRVRCVRSAGIAAADDGRRAFLACGAGIAIGAVVRVVSRRSRNDIPIRPPGALPEEDFTAACSRCGACVRACPTRVIRPDAGTQGFVGLLAPAIRIDEGVPGKPSASAYCAEYCNECNKVCPTGAIRRLSQDQKRLVRMGLAEIDKKTCIAWEKGKFCMVCHEFCPFTAIRLVPNKGVNAPEVVADRCRGCGLCQVKCPTLRGKAIVVKGRRQVELEPDPPLESPPEGAPIIG